MKKLLIMLAGALLSLPAMARNFTYTYEGKTLTYTVIDEDAKTCEVISGENVDEVLVIPSEATDGDVPYSVISIGSYAFVESHLLQVGLPESVTSIGSYAFMACRLLYFVYIPEGVTSIGEGAFAGCLSLTSVNIPNSVTSIGDRAFTDCRGLESVTIPEGVTSIREETFRGCSGLTSVTIPEGVTSIGEYAFSGCNSLTSVYYLADNLISGYKEIFSDETYQNATLYMSERGLSSYKGVSPWLYFANVKKYVPSGPTGIDDVVADFDADEPCEIYNLNGVKVGNGVEGLTPGLYISRQCGVAKKIAVK